jgi:hypothetical protein
VNKLPILPLVVDDVPLGLLQALAQEGVPVCRWRDDSAAGRLLLFDSRRGTRPTLLAGQTGIDIHCLRGDFASDPFEQLVDQGSARMHWRIGSASISEEVARVDKRSVRQQLMRRLRQLVEAAGGMWLKLSPYPFPYRSAFNFRLDHDEFVADDFHRTCEAIAGHEHAFSHYICASTHEAHGGPLARLRGSDVGSHGYWHHTYFDSQDNLKNIRRGIDALVTMGFEPSGYVAPHGRFNRGLADVLASLGITHSSEFALAYDDLPFFPPGSDVLQIPVHPICLGIFLESLRRNKQQTLDAPGIIELATTHLLRVLQARYEAGEPVFLYGHPDGRLGRHPELLRDILRSAAHCAALWMTDRTTFQRWWRQRAAVGLRLVEDGEALVLSTVRRPKEFRLAVEYWRGEHVALMPLDQRMVRFSVEALAYQKRSPRPLPQPVRIDQPQGLGGAMRRYLDWEKVTPIDEIGGSTLRGWLKKTLRRVKN